MLSKEENELLTRVGPGTPGGELMRRYWHPILPSVKLEENPVQKVRILCEDLVCYRDRQGRLGLIGPRCPHRAVDLQFGIPEEEGLRCPYHGWMFDGAGRCLQQPLEPPDSTFKEKIRIKGYPVRELAGLVWAYLGPAPAPELPLWDPLVRPGFRQIVGVRLPCNWLQVMENRGDPGHEHYTHGRLYQYALERKGKEIHLGGGWKQHEERMQRGAYPVFRPLWHEWGFTKERRASDRLDVVERRLQPVVFPYSVISGPVAAGQIRHRISMGVPIDDTTTWHIDCHCYTFPPEVEVPQQKSIAYIEEPLQDESGDFMLEANRAQDYMVWWAQGDITDRTEEHLGVSDVLVIEYRRMLRRQIDVVQDGGEPVGVFRDPALAYRPDTRIPGQLPPEDADTGEVPLARKLGLGSIFDDYEKMLEDGPVDKSPDRETLKELYRKTVELARAGEQPNWAPELGPRQQ